MTDTSKKCEEILRAISHECTAQFEKREESESVFPPVFVFEPDAWGENTLTVWKNGSHTHVGVPDGSFEQLVDSLHNLLVNGNGLSWC